MDYLFYLYINFIQFKHWQMSPRLCEMRKIFQKLCSFSISTLGEDDYLADFTQVPWVQVQVNRGDSREENAKGDLELAMIKKTSKTSKYHHVNRAPVVATCCEEKIN